MVGTRYAAIGAGVVRVDVDIVDAKAFVQGVRELGGEVQAVVGDKLSLLLISWGTRR